MPASCCNETHASLTQQCVLQRLSWTRVAGLPACDVCVEIGILPHFVGQCRAIRLSPKVDVEFLVQSQAPINVVHINLHAASASLYMCVGLLYLQPQTLYIRLLYLYACVHVQVSSPANQPLRGLGNQHRKQSPYIS